MRIAIVHHHLRPGGVTRVIHATSEILSRMGVRHVVLSGEADPSTHPGMPLRVVDGLGYAVEADARSRCTDRPPLAETLKKAACDALGGPPDVWHLHNPTLGKNPEYTRVIASLSRDGARLVLHLHDFAEEGRPQLHRQIRDIVDRHPYSPSIRHIVLNARSRDRLVAAGLPPSCVDILPNPITLPSPPCSPVPDSAPLLWFAPVRCIRRKNAGEMLLLTALAPQGTRTAVSLPPTDPEACRIQDRWNRLARKLGIAVEFAVSGRLAPAHGQSRAFESWLAASTHIVLTSVAEGFGLPFLEAIAWGKPRIGRNLPHLTDAHADAGIPTNFLYDRLLVPGEWIGKSVLHAALCRSLACDHRLRNRPAPSRTTTQQTFDRLWGDGWIDFGNLPEPLQEIVLHRLSDPEMRSVPLVVCHGRHESLMGWLAEVAAHRTPAAPPQALDAWSPQRYGENLTNLYRELITAEHKRPSFLDPQRLLDVCLDRDSFHFLCSARPRIRAIIFDLYGTLLIAPPGRIRPDPQVDPALREVIAGFGFHPPASPTSALDDAVRRHHLASDDPHPEVELRELWRDLLGLPADADMTELVIATERVRLPTSLMPGAEAMLHTIADAGLPMGILSNAQCNALHHLGELAMRFEPRLTVLSHQHGIAKPSPTLFTLLTTRLSEFGIHPEETLVVGNDPLHDIIPAQEQGFQTALFNGHPDSHRPGDAQPDLTLTSWMCLARALGLADHTAMGKSF